jgi:formate dehydrogenase subunit gamma
MWFDDVVPRWLVAVSYVIHDLSALLMLAGFIIHIYEGTAAMPGTFRAMTNGTVTEKWAWTHHPAWYRAVTSRDPRDAYERDSRHQEERARAMEAWERERGNRERS